MPVEGNVLELQKLTKLRFECKNCGCVLSLPPQEYLEWVGRREQGSLRPPLTSCPVCSKDWAVADGTTSEPAITNLVRDLLKVGTIFNRNGKDGKEGKSELGFSFSLEFSDESNAGPEPEGTQNKADRASQPRPEQKAR